MLDTSFANRAAAEVATVRAEIAILRTAGFHSPGDGGGATYHRVRAQPSHAGRLRTADGAWWEIRGHDFSALQFGARGDGVANDSEALNGALACPLVRALHFPAGRYRAIGLRLFRECAITGEAAELFWDEPGSSNYLLSISAPGANLRGLRFTGLRYETLKDPISPQRLLSIDPLTPQDGGEVRLQDLTFIGGCDGCVIGLVSNVFIDRLRFDRCRNHALVLTTGPRRIIINGLIATEIGEYGAVKTALTSTQRATERLVINDFVVTDCARADADPASWQEGLDLVCGFAREFVITNGVISNCGNGGIELKTGAIAIDEEDTYQDMLISNVVINVTGNRHAIVLNWTGRNVNSPKRGRRLLITNNVIRHEDADNAGGNAIEIAAWSDVHIANNYFEGAHSGINLAPRGASDDTASDISIAGNHMRRVQVGIRAYRGSVQGLDISGNMIGATQRGIELSGARCRDVLIAGNHMRGVRVGIFANAGDVEGFDISGNVMDCAHMGIELSGARCRDVLVAHNRIVQRGKSPNTKACIQLRNAVDVEIWDNHLQCEDGYAVMICDSSHGATGGSVLRNVVRSSLSPFRIDGGRWEVLENYGRSAPSVPTLSTRPDAHLAAAWNVRRLSESAPNDRGSVGDVALAAGNGVPPPGWWFDPGQQQGSGSWMALASPEASFRTRPMLTLTRPFERKGERGWVAPLPPEVSQLADNQEAPDGTPLRLFENGCCLSDGHHAQRTIFGEGRGRYSFWGGYLYFSTSDGSDPNANGRVYEVRLRTVEARARISPGVLEAADARPVD
jgi:hypothetical protein